MESHRSAEYFAKIYFRKRTLVHYYNNIRQLLISRAFVIFSLLANPRTMRANLKITKPTLKKIILTHGEGKNLIGLAGGDRFASKYFCQDLCATAVALKKRERRHILTTLFSLTHCARTKIHSSVAARLCALAASSFSLRGHSLSHYRLPPG